MGEKLGLNGVDNGFMIFNQYSIPRINLLNKNADVNKEGKYVPRIKDESKRFGKWFEFCLIFTIFKKVLFSELKENLNSM